MNEEFRIAKNNARALTWSGRTIAAALGWVLIATVSSCYIDELTAPPADESAITFALSGDSVLLLGDSLQLSAEYDGGGGNSVTRITWVSNDTTIARVNAVTGNVYGVGAGTTRISAYLVAPDLDNDLLRTWPMEVQYAGIGMVNDSMTGYGETRTLQARGTDTQGGLHEVVPAVFWSADDSIISLDSTGVVVALKNGTATVNASWGAFTTQAPIRVRQVAGRISFAVPELKFPVLQVDTTIGVEVRDTQDSLIVSPELTWSSTNPTVISATANGVLRALQRGGTTITVRSDTASARLTVGVAQVVTSLTVNDGNDQSSSVDAAVGTPPSVLATDANGNPVEGALVTFSIEGGGGQLVDSIRLTDTQGIARVGSWILGQVAGLHTLRASADSVSTSFQAIATPGPISAATSLVTTALDSVAAGLSAVITLQGYDAFGNQVTTGGNTVDFNIAGGTSTGTFSTTTDNGDGTYSVDFTGVVAGTAVTIGATIDGIAVTTAFPNITVIPGPPAQLAASVGQGQTAGVGLAVFVSPGVLVTDAFNNPVMGAMVDFTVTAGGGTVSGTPAISDRLGVAHLGSWTLGPTPGVNTLSASNGGLTPVTFTATGVSNLPSALTSVVTATADTILAGTISTITLQTKDSLGNNLTVGGFTVMFTVSGGTSTGTLSATTDNGDGTYTATFSGELAGTGVTIGATINGAAVQTSLPTITVLPGAVSTVTSLVTSSVSTLVAGTNSILTLDTKDAFGNDIPTGGKAVTFNLSGGTSTGTIGVTTDNGDGTYTTTLTGQLTGTAVTVGATIDGAPVTSALPTVTVIPGAVSTATSVVTSSLATVVAGANTVITLVTKDVLGNDLTAGGHTVVFSAAGGSSTGAISSTTDNGDGTYTATLTGQLAGTATTISATIDGNPVTTTLPTVTVIPGAASVLTSLVTVSADTIASDGIVSLVLDTKDSFGNDLTSGGYTVAFSVAGGTSTGTISATTDNGDGTYTANFTGLLAGTATTVSASIDGQAVTTTPPTITVIPGAPVNIAVNGGDSQLALFGTAVAIAPSVIVTDNNGNPVAGVSVTFAVTGGGGVVVPITPVTTDASGIAAPTTWTLGSVLGTNTLTATATGIGSVAFTATAISSLPITLEETVVAYDTTGTVTLPAIAGGVNQTYVMLSSTIDQNDLTSVSGGGLTWTEQIEQCAGTRDSWGRIWTAQGSAASPFQVTVNVGAVGQRISVVLARYANVGAIEGVTGNNNNDLKCPGGSPPNTQPTLSLTSTVAYSIHVVGISVKPDSVINASAGYTKIGSITGGNEFLSIYGYQRAFATATTDVFTATLNQPARWATHGLILRPN